MRASRAQEYPCSSLSYLQPPKFLLPTSTFKPVHTLFLPSSSLIFHNHCLLSHPTPVRFTMGFQLPPHPRSCSPNHGPSWWTWPLYSLTSSAHFHSHQISASPRVSSVTPSAEFQMVLIPGSSENQDMRQETNDAMLLPSHQDPGSCLLLCWLITALHPPFQPGPHPDAWSSAFLPAFYFLTPSLNCLSSELLQEPPAAFPSSNSSSPLLPECVLSSLTDCITLGGNLPTRPTSSSQHGMGSWCLPGQPVTSPRWRLM